MNKAKVFGRIAGLSTVLATLILVVFFVLTMTRPSVQARAAADGESATTGCTLATIKGNYGSLGIGLSPVFSHTGIFTPNGAGQWVYNYTQNMGGVISSGTESGTYTLSSSCAATFTITSFDGGNLTYAGVVVTTGAEIDLMTTIPSQIQSWVVKKIN